MCSARWACWLLLLTKALDFENVFKVLKWLCLTPSPVPNKHTKDMIGIGMSPVHHIDAVASSNYTLAHSPLTRIALVQALALTRMASGECATPQLQRPQDDCRAICEEISRIRLPEPHRPRGTIIERERFFHFQDMLAMVKCASSIYSQISFRDPTVPHSWCVHVSRQVSAFCR